MKTSKIQSSSELGTPKTQKSEFISENLNFFQSDFIIVSVWAHWDHTKFKYTRLNNGPFLGEDHRVCKNDTLFYQKFRSVWLLTGLGNIRLEAVRCIPLHFAIWERNRRNNLDSGSTETSRRGETPWPLQVLTYMRSKFHQKNCQNYINNISWQHFYQ